MSHDTESTAEAINNGINKYMVKLQGLIIPALLSLIGFFVMQVFFTVKDIAADNARFNTYVVANDLWKRDMEKWRTSAEEDIKSLKESHFEVVKKEADDWSEFWKNYGFFFSATGQRPRKASH